MWPNPQFSVDLVTFTEEILNRKLHFLCNDNNNYLISIWPLNAASHVLLSVKSQKKFSKLLSTFTNLGKVSFQIPLQSFNFCNVWKLQLKSCKVLIWLQIFKHVVKGAIKSIFFNFQTICDQQIGKNATQLKPFPMHYGYWDGQQNVGMLVFILTLHCYTFDFQFSTGNALKMTFQNVLKSSCLEISWWKYIERAPSKMFSKNFAIGV